MDTTTNQHDPASLLGNPGGTLTLAVRSSDGTVEQVAIASAKCTIGSDASCTIQVSGQPLSCVILRGQQHTVVRRWAESVTLNENAFRDAKLQLGDVIAIGDVEVCVVADHREAAVQPPEKELLNFDGNTEPAQEPSRISELEQEIAALKQAPELPSVAFDEPAEPEFNTFENDEFSGEPAVTDFVAGTEPPAPNVNEVAGFEEIQEDHVFEVTPEPTSNELESSVANDGVAAAANDWDAPAVASPSSDTFEAGEVPPAVPVEEPSFEPSFGEPIQAEEPSPMAASEPSDLFEFFEKDAMSQASESVQPVDSEPLASNEPISGSINLNESYVGNDEATGFSPVENMNESVENMSESSNSDWFEQNSAVRPTLEEDDWFKTDSETTASEPAVSEPTESRWETDFAPVSEQPGPIVEDQEVPMTDRESVAPEEEVESEDELLDRLMASLEQNVADEQTKSTESDEPKAPARPRMDTVEFLDEWRNQEEPAEAISAENLFAPTPAPIEKEPAMPETPAPTPTAEETPDEGEVSIEQYMNQLLKRASGDSSPPDTTVEAPKTVVQETVEEVPEEVAVMDASEFVPRSQAPETNLRAMRELANQSARSAIDRHAKRRVGSSATSNVIISISLMMVGAMVAAFGNHWLPLYPIGGVVAVAGVGVLLKGMFSGNKKQSKSKKK